MACPLTHRSQVAALVFDVYADKSGEERENINGATDPGPDGLGFDPLGMMGFYSHVRDQMHPDCLPLYDDGLRPKDFVRSSLDPIINSICKALVIPF